MLIEQKKWTTEGWSLLKPVPSLQPQLVLVFGSTTILTTSRRYQEVHDMYPSATIVLCSTAGEILDQNVFDDSLVVTAIQFEKTTLNFQSAQIHEVSESESVGASLAAALPQDGLMHVLVFSDGLHVNGSSLLRGISSSLSTTVSVTGGMVGDGARFQNTVLGLNQEPNPNGVILIGLYGSAIRIGYGSLGGWDPFGPERMITKSTHNILYEVDNQPVLPLYKTYLGDKAKDLPGSGLLFPLELTIPTNKGPVKVVRTLLSVNETDQSMTFAGDMPQGVPAKLMKANFERLIDGAVGAANMSVEQLTTGKTEFALLISCIGRKLVLGPRVAEEIDAVRSVLGPQATITGFYSYGELCPVAATEKQCQLHNQTMTITTLREA